MLSLDQLFRLAGYAMAAHLAASTILLFQIGPGSLADELFLLPNSWLGTKGRETSFRLLRAKFFLPWVPKPHGLEGWGLWAWLMFTLARWTGTAFPLLMLAFFAAAFVEAGH